MRLSFLSHALDCKVEEKLPISSSHHEGGNNRLYWCVPIFYNPKPHIVKTIQTRHTEFVMSGEPFIHYVLFN